MSKARAQLVCDICGQPAAKIQRVSRTYGQSKELFVIEGIPTVRCGHCGESYLTAETLHEIERLKLHHKELAEQRAVGIVRFA